MHERFSFGDLSDSTCIVYVRMLCAHSLRALDDNSVDCVSTVGESRCGLSQTSRRRADALTSGRSALGWLVCMVCGAPGMVRPRVKKHAVPFACRTGSQKQLAPCQGSYEAVCVVSRRAQRGSPSVMVCKTQLNSCQDRHKAARFGSRFVLSFSPRVQRLHEVARLLSRYVKRGAPRVKVQTKGLTLCPDSSPLVETRTKCQISH